MSFSESTMDYLIGLCEDLYNTTCTDSQLRHLIRALHAFRYNTSGGGPPFDIWRFLEQYMYPRRDSLAVVIPITIIYSILLVTGVLGNICTCFVIARNKFMHTATNFYLFNLAIADLLLLVIGLPPDLYSVWSLYPWVFGETLCVMRAFVCEISTNTSILTITAFTVERYVAICFPMKAQKMSSLPRAARVIVCVWIVAVCTAIPIANQYGVVKMKDPRNRTIDESAMCTYKHAPITGWFLASTCFFFIVPMIFISVLYSLIAAAIHRSTIDAPKIHRSSSDASKTSKEQITCLRDSKGRTDGNVQLQARARRSVLKMLVAVVVAFFVCWAPFHAERMMTVSITVWTVPLLRIYRILFYVSGIFYFINGTVNPVLYSVMSFKFRQGLRETILKPKCCRRPIKFRKKLPFSKLVLANSHTETAYTSMPPRFINKTGRTLQEHELIPQNEAQTSGSHSPAPSISGSSLKSTDGMSQEEDLQQVLLQINVIERQFKNDVSLNSAGKSCTVEGLMEVQF
ncbi:pyrokinin-1 receptor-like [Saccostrea echinata]|uniref:pyrokinin-1 receptor-like n=1 Tax=Saccostrea echinata TaxID=191078 RepID=UPI002A7FEFA1|nr:pyrokinin-1 receptor-like [Saccostrea echinata]